MRLLEGDARVVTLTGRSGIGKTRTAIEVAHRAGHRWPGGAVLVDVGRIDDPALLVPLVADALGASIADVQSTEDAIRRRLRHGPTLLVADDLDAVPGAIDQLLGLLDLSPASRILATAQRPVQHADGRLVRLSPLAVPPDDARDLAAIAATPGVELFVERATAADPTFRLGPDNAEMVAEITRRLDGLPLAIELGAARTRVLPPAAQLRTLDGNATPDLRRRPGEAVPARQVDLRSAVAATEALAGEPARIVLRRMAVGGSPATIERIRDIAAEPGQTLAELVDALGELHDLGLLEIEPGLDGEPRFRLLPTVAAYGRERLAEAGEAEAIARRHEAAVIAAGRGTRTMAADAQRRALEREAMDLQAVFGRLAGAPDRLVEALDMAIDLAPLWGRRGLAHGAVLQFDGLLDATESDDVDATAIPIPTHVEALCAWARLVVHRPTPSSHREAVVRRLQRATALAADSGDPRLRLLADETVAECVFLTGDTAGYARAAMEAAALAVSIQDHQAMIRADYRQAIIAGMAGRPADAAMLASRALEAALAERDLRSIIRSTYVLQGLPAGTPGISDRVPSLEALLDAALRADEPVDAALLYPRIASERFLRGDVAGGASWVVDGLAFAQAHGAWYAGGFCVIAVAFVAAAVGQDEAVARFHGSQSPILAELLVGLGPDYGPRYQAVLGTVRERLGAARFDQLVADGALLDRDTALQLAMVMARSLSGESGTEPTESAAPGAAAVTPDRIRGRLEGPAGIEALTPRELDVLRALMTGATNQRIGEALGLRPKTVMHHSVSIYGKLGVRGRTEAAAWAFRQGVEAMDLDEQREATG